MALPDLRIELFGIVVDPGLVLEAFVEVVQNPPDNGHNKDKRGHPKGNVGEIQPVRFGSGQVKHESSSASTPRPSKTRSRNDCANWEHVLQTIEKVADTFISFPEVLQESDKPVWKMSTRL